MKKIGNYKTWFTSGDLMILFFCVLITLARFYLTKIDFKDGQRLRISASVVSDPIAYPNYQIVYLPNFSVKLPIFPSVEYQDYITIEGVYKNKNIEKAQLVNLVKSQSLLVQTRKRIINIYQKVLPEPYSALLSGTVLGAKSSLSLNFWEKLKNTGTAHVVVASGMNVTLVAGFILSLLINIFPRKLSSVIAILFIWIYVFLVGPQAPIVRAALMGTIAFGAQSVGRLSTAIRALIISALIMLMYKPLWLFDISFILSFSATLSLMLFQKRIDEKVKFLPAFFREGFSTSLAAQVFVAPIIYLSFGQFNLLSPVINALVLWTISYITILGSIAGIIGQFSFELAKIIIWLIYPLVWWFVFVVEKFG